MFIKLEDKCFDFFIAWQGRIHQNWTSHCQDNLQSIILMLSTLMLLTLEHLDSLLIASERMMNCVM